MQAVDKTSHPVLSGAVNYFQKHRVHRVHEKMCFRPAQFEFAVVYGGTRRILYSKLPGVPGRGQQVVTKSHPNPVGSLTSRNLASPPQYASIPLEIVVLGSEHFGRSRLSRQRLNVPAEHLTR